MKTVIKPYDPSRDFIRIRDFLVDTFAIYQRPFNWTIERWNFCRYHVIPLHNYYNVRHFSVPTRPHQNLRNELELWEKNIFIWENEQDEIVAVVLCENEEPGEAWLQIHPDYTFLYEEMVVLAEAKLADRVNGIGYVKLYVNDGSELEQIAIQHGYRKLKSKKIYLEYKNESVPEPKLPARFEFKSVLEEDNPEKRGQVKALAFNRGYAPSSWAPASAFKSMQLAPDYRKDLDLFIVAPNGEYIAFCTIWVDERNRYANFEPVGTHPEYQRMGLGRELLKEGFRRMAQYGVTRSFMDSSNEFYKKVGFKETPYSYSPWIKYFEV